VNNEGAGTSRAEQNSNSPNKLLEQSNETPMDGGPSQTTGDGDSRLEALEKINRPSNT
jgi:hypothetical protein